MIQTLLGAIAQISENKAKNDDDFADRLNHRYTTFLLIVFAVVVSTKQYVGEPITCWCPAQFTDNHEDFANKICWVSNTYYVPMREKHIPGEEEPKSRIGYYQWVPMILICQALCFYIPRCCWRFLNNKAGIDVNSIVEAAQTLQAASYTESREKTVRFMARHLDRYLCSTREYRRGCLVRCKHRLAKFFCLVCGRRYGNYLVILYLLVKMLYLTNVVGQLFLLNAFLSTNYHLFGIQVLHGLITNGSYTAPEVFPRVTLCDFKIRRMANIHRHTVQCVLPINFFNEKVYIFIWFWLVFVGFATTVSFITWLCRTLLRTDQARYIRHHLKAMERISKGNDRRLIMSFVRNYLRQDGMLVLRIMASNTNELVVAEVIAELWNHFRTTRPNLNRRHTDTNSSLNV